MELISSRMQEECLEGLVNARLHSVELIIIVLIDQLRRAAIARYKYAASWNPERKRF